MRGARSGPRLLPALLLLLVIACAGILVGTARAEDGEGGTDAAQPVAEEEGSAEAPPPPVDGEATEAGDDPPPSFTARLETALRKEPWIVGVVSSVRLLAAILTAWLLVGAYRRWSGRRAGLLPDAPAPARATTLMGLPESSIILLFYVLVPSLLAVAVVKLNPEFKGSLVLSVVVITVIALPLVTGLALRRRSLRPGVRASPYQVMRWGFLTFSVVITLASVAGVLVTTLLKAMGHETTVADLVEKALSPEHPENLWATAFLAVFVAPFIEEVLFRGLLFPSLRDALGDGKRGTWVAAIVVSALFAAFHQHLESFFPLFLLAMVFTWVFERTNSLATVIVAHALFNAVNLLPFVLLRLQGVPV